MADPRPEIDFALELLDRLGSAKLPWKTQKLRACTQIINDSAIIVAECYDSAGIVPELIVRAVNALPAIAAELAVMPADPVNSSGDALPCTCGSGARDPGPDWHGVTCPRANLPEARTSSQTATTTGENRP